MLSSIVEVEEDDDAFDEALASVEFEDFPELTIMNDCNEEVCENCAE